jgi:hypothetical protein
MFNEIKIKHSNRYYTVILFEFDCNKFFYFIGKTFLLKFFKNIFKCENCQEGYFKNQSNCDKCAINCLSCINSP